MSGGNKMGILACLKLLQFCIFTVVSGVYVEKGDPTLVINLLFL